MLMADILAIALTIIGLALTLAAHWIATAALFPRFTARAAAAYGRRPVASGFLGLAVALPLVGIGFAGSSAAPEAALKVLFAGLALTPILVGLAGSAGLAQRIGMGLGSTGSTASVIRGSAVLVGTFLAPIVGWFIVLPWTLLSGIGATVLALRDRSDQPLASAAPASVTAPTGAPVTTIAV